MGQVILNIATAFPYSTFVPDQIIIQALKDGFDAISMLPTWRDPSRELWYKLKYVEKPWNPGDPIAYLKGLLTQDRHAPKLHDVLLFPWYRKWWKPKFDHYVDDGAESIVHSIGHFGILEISPKVLMSGLEAVEYQIHTEGKICADSYHAVRKVWESERRPGESLQSFPLGNWQPWVAKAAEAGILAIVDFHPEPARFEDIDFELPSMMLRHARNHGFTGDIRVEISLPLGQQLFRYREMYLKALEEIKSIVH